MLITPGGKPASRTSWASLGPYRGESSAVLMITTLPVATAGANFAVVVSLVIVRMELYTSSSP